MSAEIKRLEGLQADGTAEYPFILANVKTAKAKAAIPALKKFLRKEITQKITDIEEGTYRRRKAEKNANKGRES